MRDSDLVAPVVAQKARALGDPVGMVGDPAYDAGVALRDWHVPLLGSDDPVGLARRYCGSRPGSTA